MKGLCSTSLRKEQTQARRFKPRSATVRLNPELHLYPYPPMLSQKLLHLKEQAPPAAHLHTSFTAHCRCSAAPRGRLAKHVLLSKPTLQEDNSETKEHKLTEPGRACRASEESGSSSPCCNQQEQSTRLSGMLHPSPLFAREPFCLAERRCPCHGTRFSGSKCSQINKPDSEVSPGSNKTSYRAPNHLLLGKQSSNWFLNGFKAF